MNYLSNYTIAFKGLKEGIHEFEFSIDKKFFEEFENSELNKGNIIADVTLTKQSNLMILDIAIKGDVNVQCDRCLEDYQQLVKNELRLYIKFGNVEESDVDLIVLSHEDYQINIAQYIYETIIFGIPLKHVHPDDEDGNSTCDPEMIEKLEEYLIEDVSEEEPENDIWKELKKLLDNK